MIVAIACLSTVLIAGVVFAFGLTFAGRVVALLGAQFALALHVVLGRWESIHWLIWPIGWPAAETAVWLHPVDPNASFFQSILWAIEATILAGLLSFVANSIILGVLTGLIYDTVRRIRRWSSKRAPGVVRSTQEVLRESSTT